MVIAETEAGLSLVQAGRWSEARSFLEDAIAKEPSPDVLVGMAESLLWTGDVPGSITHYRRAYAGYRRQGKTVESAFAAFETAIAYKCFQGNEAAAFGWLARAESVAQEGDPTLVQGWLWSFRAYLTTDHDLRLAEDLAKQAIDHARLTADRDLELVTLSNLGVVLARAGRVEDGFRLIDESMAGISAGEHTRHGTTVIVCCSMLMACELGADMARATQWCRVADQFHEEFGCPFLYSECRAIYGSILTALGRWPEAERELRTAIEITKGVYPAVFIMATASLAELRLRQGRLEEAESMLAGLEHDVRATQALAGVKLARQELGTAAQLLKRVLRHDDPESIPAVRALAMLIEVELLSVDLQKASEDLATVERMCSSKPWPEARARAGMAAGLVLARSGDIEAAAARFEQAVQCFSQLGMVFEVATARLAAARIATDSHPDLATIEARAALKVFDELGARAEADKASALLRTLGVPSAPGPKRIGLLTEREQEVLKLLSQGLSNPEIAGRLYISRKTASHHVSSLLSKLALRNRAEAVAFAARAGGIT